MRLKAAIVFALVGAGALAFGTFAALGGSSASGNAPLFAALDGGSEVGAASGAGPSSAGDPNGRGSATVIAVGRGKICFAILVSGIGKPAAAHIHRGASGVAGPVVIPLVHPNTGSPGTSSGCVNAQASVIAEMQADPGGFYVNVHNAAFPGGAVRGQLF